jgi:hypothetical protein
MDYERNPKLLRVIARALLLAIAVLPLTARADFFNHTWDDHYSEHKVLVLEPSFTYYQTNANFYVTGTDSKVAGLTRYSRSMADLSASYGLTPRLSFFGRASWAAISMDHSTLTGSSYGLADQTFGGTYRLIEVDRGKTLPFSLDLQAQGDFPAYNNTSVSGPFLDDGTVDLTAGAFVTYPIAVSDSSSFFLHGGAGYTWRSRSFSQAIPWSARLTWDLRSSGWRLEAGMFGVQSLRTDPNLGSTELTRETNGAGGSFRINAVDPSFMAASGLVGRAIGSQMMLTASAAGTFWGDGAPSGVQFTLGAVLFWDRGKRRNSVFLTPAAYGKANQGFVDYASGGLVSEVNDRLHLVKMDQGSQNGVEVGQIYDIFRPQAQGEGEAIARAQVLSVKDDEAVLKITEYFKEVWIEKGFLLKHPLQ